MNFIIQGPNGIVETNIETPAVAESIYTFVEGDFLFGDLFVQASNGTNMRTWKIYFQAKRLSGLDAEVVGARVDLYADGDPPADDWTAELTLSTNQLILTMAMTEGDEVTTTWVYVGTLSIQQPDPPE